MKQIDHDPHKPTDDRKNLWICIAFVMTALVMGGLVLLLKTMSLDFVLGFACGFFLMFGLAGILVKDFRNLS